jgi:hypothetical protein
LLFNRFASRKVPIDKWVIFDAIQGAINIAAIIFIGMQSPQNLNDYAYKEYLDLFIVVVVCVDWFRFILYFLLIKELSTLLLTLYGIFFDILPFLLILGSYFLFVSSVFTTLY